MTKTPNIDIRDDYQKNHIINGDMEFFQRGNSILGMNGNPSVEYTADRFGYRSITGLSVDATRVSDHPENGNYSLRHERTGATVAPIAAMINMLQYSIEGYDIVSLIGKKITLSFNIKASEPGLYPVSFYNGASNRSYVTEYEILSANTWERQTFTFDVENTSHETTSGNGLIIRWGASIGTDFHTATTDQWIAGDFYGTAASQRSTLLVQNSYMQLSQVQITEGAEDLPFRRAGRTYGDELILCQRYYEKSADQNQPPNTTSINGAFEEKTSLSTDRKHIDYKVWKRVDPTVVAYNPDNGGATGQWRDVTGATNRTVGALSSTGRSGINFSIVGAAENSIIRGHWSADAELS